MKPDSRAFEHMRLAVEALVTHSGPVRARLQATVPYFGVVLQSKMRTDAEEHLRLRIGAGLVEGGEEEDDESYNVEIDASYDEIA
jgi:hypothetical protein